MTAVETSPAEYSFLDIPFYWTCRVIDDCAVAARSTLGKSWHRADSITHMSTGFLFVVPDNHRAELIHKKEGLCDGYHRFFAQSANPDTAHFGGPPNVRFRGRNWG